MQVQMARASSDFGTPFFQGRFPTPVVDTPDAADPLDTLGTAMTVAPGCEIYAEGDPASYWYLVRSGVLRTCKLLADGRRQIDDFLFPGDVFGFEARAEHNFSAEAVTGATMVRYSRTRLELLAADDPRLGVRMLQVTLKRLGKAHERLLLLGRKTADEKLASFLLEMLVRSTQRDMIELPMSRSDIGDYLGLTIETVSRTFSRFKQQRMITLPTAHCVTIVDQEALEALSGDE